MSLHEIFQVTFQLGKCNVSLYSYRHGTTLSSASAIQWSAIYDAGMKISTSCLAANRGGGATVIDGMFPVLHFLHSLSSPLSYL